MKKLFKSILLSSLILNFVSCVYGPDSNNPNNQNQTTDLQNVTVVNQSKFDVNVFIGHSPYYDEAANFSIKKKSSDTVQIEPSGDVGHAVYFEYLIDIGNAQFPYWKRGSYTSLNVIPGKSTTLYISELQECQSKSAYFLIENNTNLEIQLINGSMKIRPAATEQFLIPAKGGCGVYEAGDDSCGISFGHYDKVKIISGEQEIPLPITTSQIEAGNIYTIVLTTDSSSGKEVTSASLKAVTPFDIDTQKKIWSFDSNVFEFAPVMRSAADPKDGMIVAGTLKKDHKTIQLERVNVYGVFQNGVSMEINDKDLEKVNVLDFVERSDGSIVLLILLSYSTESDAWTEEKLYIYNFETKQEILNLSFQKQGLSLVWTTQDAKNKLCLVDDNTIAIVGAANYYDYTDEENIYNRFHHFFGVLNISDLSNVTLKTYISSDFDDFASTETLRQFSSVYFDGTDYYVCGYENWDIRYNKLSHKGVIYKFSSDLSTRELIYNADKTLFFSIAGNKSNFYVCGEYADNGSILKGTFVSSKMIAAGSNPVLYTTDLPNCWFNQFCLYGNKIVLCGTSSESSNGEGKIAPVVAAYSLDGTKLWDKTCYSGYTNASNIVPNSIGTFYLQLEKLNNSGYSYHFVSTNLLGEE